MVTPKSLIIGLVLLVAGSGTVWAVSGELGPLSDAMPFSDHPARHGRPGAGMGMGGPHGGMEGHGHGSMGNHSHEAMGNHTHGNHTGGHGAHGGHGHGPGKMGPGHDVVFVARCLQSENHSEEQCVQMAQRMAEHKVDRAEACLEDHTAGECARHAAPPVGRLFKCLEENSADDCADRLATHTLCVASRIAGVESPVECPTPDEDDMGA